MMAKRYEDHPEVIGYDIRNEAPLLYMVPLGMTRYILESLVDLST
jgi:hypothetical protein